MSVQENLSDIESESQMSNEDFNQDIISETWADHAKNAVEKLSTKDQLTREKYMKFLLACMRKHYAAEEMQADSDTIKEKCEWALTKGSHSEKKIASKLLQVLQVTYPDLELKDKTLSNLRVTCSDEEDDKASREIALKNYYFYKFVEMETDTQEDLSELQELFLDDEIHTTAINMFALMMTLLDDEAKSDLLEDVGNHLLPTLEQDNTAEFNIAAGKLLCQMMEAYHRQGRTDCDYIAYKLTQIMEEHSTYAPKATHSKKTAKEQRRMFREFLDTFENHTEPVHTVIVNGHEINLQGWNQIVRYDYLTDILKGGINEHMTENPVVRGMLNVVQDTSAKRGSLSKTAKLYRSKKDRYQEDRSQRNGLPGMA